MRFRAGRPASRGTPCTPGAVPLPSPWVMFDSKTARATLAPAPRSRYAGDSLDLFYDLFCDTQRERGNRERRVHSQRRGNDRSIGDVKSLIKRASPCLSLVKNASVLIHDSTGSILCHAAAT